MRGIKKLVVAIGGASGVHLGLKFIECVPDSIELFVVVSEGAKDVAKHELDYNIKESFVFIMKMKWIAR